MTIDMRGKSWKELTLEEVQTALQRCTAPGGGCKGCPLQYSSDDCSMGLMLAALMHIRELEAVCKQQAGTLRALLAMGDVCGTCRHLGEVPDEDCPMDCQACELDCPCKPCHLASRYEPVTRTKAGDSHE